jgi:hypothetical protein
MNKLTWGQKAFLWWYRYVESGSGLPDWTTPARRRISRTRQWLRGHGWQFHVADSINGDPLRECGWEYSEANYIWPDGGWVSAHVSIACIRRAVEGYRARTGDMQTFQIDG